MKKIINKPEEVVPEMLEGFERSHSGLVRLLPEQRVVLRRTPKPPEKVALISGGGSGHEPSHAGYVGPGMLDAAVAGNVFASPNPEQLLAGLIALKNKAGVLMIIKNYSGDSMNFGLAADMAAEEGVTTDSVVVNDDVALAGRDKPDWRRGIAGTVLVHKIAGAAAEKGLPLAEVKRVAEKTIAGLGSMGVALTPCIVPEAGKPGFTLGDGEMEMGLGIHGEAGARKTPILPADAVAEELVKKIRDDVGLKSGERVAALVNGLGGTPPMELYIMARALHRLAGDAGLTIAWSLVGNYMTSLEMAGLSLTLLRLDPELEEFLAAPARTPALIQ
ncbi:MAG: dihydroxyacetone kinase subunit DhaK [Planctomycetota bacterium]|jgi:dihydroxyacetone kinase-like protein|nr:dihydroxyacetone kinase subunit DhaK [Planctomycetota bacterium]